MVFLLGPTRPADATVLQQAGFSLDVIATLSDFSSTGELQATADGNIWLVSPQRRLYRVSADGLTQEHVATASLTPRALFVEGNTAFLGDEDVLRSVDLTAPRPAPTSLIRDLNASIRSIERIPAGWGIHSGRLAIATMAGLYSYDEVNNILTLISGVPASALAFTETGDLLLANYNSNKIDKITPSLSHTTYFNGIAGPDGLAYHPGTGALYVASAGSGQILEIGPGGVGIASFATGIQFNGGNAPSHIGFSTDHTQLFWVDPQVGQLQSTAGFSAYGGGDSGGPGGREIPIGALGALLMVGAGLTRKIQSPTKF